MVGGALARWRCVAARDILRHTGGHKHSPACLRGRGATARALLRAAHYAPLLRLPVNRQERTTSCCSLHLFSFSLLPAMFCDKADGRQNPTLLCLFLRTWRGACLPRPTTTARTGARLAAATFLRTLLLRRGASRASCQATSWLALHNALCRAAPVYLRYYAPAFCGASQRLAAACCAVAGGRMVAGTVWFVTSVSCYPCIIRASAAGGRRLSLSAARCAAFFLAARRQRRAGSAL